jgi:hypothetical protein
MKSHAKLFSLQQLISLSCHSQRNKRLRWQMGRQLLVAPQSQRGFYPLIYHPHEPCPSFSTFGVSDFFQIFPDLGFGIQSSEFQRNFQFFSVEPSIFWCGVFGPSGETQFTNSHLPCQYFRFPPADQWIG